MKNEDFEGEQMEVQDLTFCDKCASVFFYPVLNKHTTEQTELEFYERYWFCPICKNKNFEDVRRI